MMNQANASPSSVTRPEFCPRPWCIYHNREFASTANWYTHKEAYMTKARGPIRRFKCKACGKTCSTQTFSIHYWTHQTTDMQAIDKHTYSCSGARQTCRAMGISIRVLQNRQARLARNYLNCFDAGLTGHVMQEDASFDGFESFIGSQYRPVNYQVLVGSKSQFPYMMNLHIMNRKGRMTADQKAVAQMIKEHFPIPPKALRERCKELFSLIPPMLKHNSSEKPWNLYTDEHREYPAAMKELDEFHKLLECKTIIHTRINSKEARTHQNKLFPSNYMDREIRKNLAGHVRETVRFDREVNMAMTRMIIMLGHHGFLKPHRIGDKINQAKEPTHGDMALIGRKKLVKIAKRRLYTHRHLWSHQRGKFQWMRQVWHREYVNPPQVNLVQMLVLLVEKEAENEAAIEKPKKAAKLNEDELKLCWGKKQPGNGYRAFHLAA